MQIAFRCAETRVLLPFRMRVPNDSPSIEGFLDGNKGNLCAGLGSGGGWAPTKGHSTYYLEYLPHVQRFLFGSQGGGCVYSPLWSGQTERLDLAEVFLGDLDAGSSDSQSGQPSPRGLQLLGRPGPFVWNAPAPFEKTDRQLQLRASLHAEHGMELWLNAMGVGVLSITLRCEPVRDQPAHTSAFFAALLQLNHALATAQKSVWLREGSDRPPMHLHQLARDALRPLWDDEQTKVMFDLRGVVFTALGVTIESHEDGEKPSAQLASCHEQLSRLLPHLAQLHPPSHPGEIGAGHAIHLPINNEHLCCIDQSGGAHAAIIQDPENSYARNRISRIQQEYFPGFLLAAIQRLCLQRILDESTAASTLPADRQQEARQKLLEKVLRFGLEGEFVQVAWRTTIQRHHEAAQRAFEVQEGLSTTRNAMTDFTRMATHRTAEQQRSEAERAAQERHQETARTERTMQVLEVFIVTFYSVELAHILGEAFRFGHTAFVGWSLVAVALASFGMGTLLVSWKWLQKQRPRWTIISLFVMATAIHTGFLAANAWWAGHAHSDSEATESEATERNHEPRAAGSVLRAKRRTSYQSTAQLAAETLSRA